MRAVLYTNDMEPITVLNLPIEVHQFEFVTYRVPILEPIRTRAPGPNSALTNINFRIVDITVERFCRNNEIYPLFITHNEELALLLKSEPLPGQIKGYQEARRAAYRKGFIDGLLRALKGIGDG